MKKKMFLALTCLFTLGIVKSVAQTAVAALHHNGSVTLYSGSNLQAALTNSHKGDTLYLSEGTFQKGNNYEAINVNNGQVLIGTGEKTIIGESIFINQNTSTKENDCVLEGLNIKGDIQIKNDISGMVISQCQFDNLRCEDNIILDCVIYRSYIKKELELSMPFSGLSVVNSKVRSVHLTNGLTGGNANFLNCNINEFGVQDSESIFTNCIIQTQAKRYSSNFIYCLMGTNSAEDSRCTNCWTIGSAILDDNLESSQKLNDYLGNDGTVVGITGGDNPYTLTPSAPHVASHKIEVDKANQKLNVTLTIEN